MEILSVDVERMLDSSYCGTLAYRDPDGEEGTLLWTMELLENTKIVVVFVQGDRDNWLELCQEYARFFSDNINLVITRRKNKQTAQESTSSA